jgi:hypothetical protein
MGRFFFPVMATLANHDLVFEEDLDFGFCPVKESTTRTITLRNVGELDTAFKWDVLDPFKITPREGVVKRKEQTKITVEFSPTQAMPFLATSVCTYGDVQRTFDSPENEISKIMNIHGVGKMSHLLISSDKIVKDEDTDLVSIDYGEVHIAKTLTYTITLVNPSLVLSNFTIKQAATSENAASRYRFSHYKGSILPGQSQKIDIEFAPTCPNYFSMEYFDISTVSGNSIRLACSGTGIGPVVRISQKLINFGDLKSGEVCSRALTLTNSSKVDASYEVSSS